MFGFKKKNDLQQEIDNYKNNSDFNYRSYGNSADFKITIEDVFTITGRGTVIVGKIQSGTISVGDSVRVLDRSGSQKQIVTVTGIEMFRKLLNTASAGDNVGLLLQNVKRTDVMKGDMLVK